MTIETDRLRIYTASEAEMTRMIREQTDADLKTAYEEMLQGCLAHPAQWNWYAVWIIARKGGTKVGDLSFKGLQADGSVEIGYGISEEYRGLGYASEAVNAAVLWALRQSGVSRVEAETEPGNRASQRVLEKCGFTRTGVIGEEGPRFVRISGGNHEIQ